MASGGINERRGDGHGSWRGRGAAARVAVLLGLLGTGACSDDGPGENPAHAWLELGPGGERIARAVTTAASCPSILIDGRKTAMQVRAKPDPPMFPILTCEATVPPAARRAAVGELVLPLPPTHVERIAIIGDTGCRVLDGHEVQDCDDPAAWPFAGLADAVTDLVGWLRGEPDDDGDLDDLARSIAALDPDLIVHVGDYVYREGPCPDGHSGCAESPYGYGWDTMEADFFVPAAPLLRTAALVAARGNHELCNRAGALWFRFLDPRPFDGSCADYTEPYSIEVGGRQLLVLDSAAAQDRSVDPAQTAVFRQQFEQLDRLAGPHAFLVTHRPLWVFGHAGEKDGHEQLFRGNPTLEVASRNELPAGVDAVLAGHVHVFQALGFAGTRPPQIVVGNSGTGLDPVVTTPLDGLEIAGATVVTGRTVSAFGFATLEAEAADWLLTARNLAGIPLLRCTITGKTLACL